MKINLKYIGIIISRLYIQQKKDRVKTLAYKEEIIKIDSKRFFS